MTDEEYLESLKELKKLEERYSLAADQVAVMGTLLASLRYFQAIYKKADIRLLDGRDMLNDYLFMFRDTNDKDYEVRINAIKGIL